MAEILPIERKTEDILYEFNSFISSRYEHVLLAFHYIQIQNIDFLKSVSNPRAPSGYYVKITCILKCIWFINTLKLSETSDFFIFVDIDFLIFLSMDFIKTLRRFVSRSRKEGQQKSKMEERRRECRESKEHAGL